MNSQQIRQAAEKIYMQQQTVRAQYEKMGMKPTATMLATAQEIEAHIQMVEDVAAEYGVNLDYGKFAFGTSREQVVAAAEAKVGKSKRSAGARALSAKYGKEAAEEIIRRKTGKKINLQR